MHKVDELMLSLICHSTWDDINVKQMNYDINGWVYDEEHKGEIDITIGKIECYLFDEEILQYELIESMDAVSVDAAKAYYSFYHPDLAVQDVEYYHEQTYYLDWELPIRLLYLHTFEIHQPYRGKGLFKKAMELLIKDLEKEKVHHILLTPSPYERGVGGTFIHKTKQEKERITKYYQSIGFEKTIGLLSPEEYFMIKPLYEI